MRLLIASVALLLLSALALGQRKAKAPEVQVIESRARRGDEKILIDGRVRVTAPKPLHGLVVFFDLMAPENNVVASEKAVLDDGPVEPGDERSWHSETAENVRAVRYKIRAFDGAERELRVANAGPFPIE